MKLSKIFASLLCVSVLSVGAAMAETSFTPLNFDESNAVKAPATTTSRTVSGVQAKSTDLLDPAQVTGGTKMQTAITEIDKAQMEVRNNLLNYKAKYAEIDSKYQTTKTERAAMRKQIRQAEKKIKNLDKAKKSIRKNFERKSNI
jgi:septal ring factor EnvC (AmiA/AmiB activator)